MMKLAWLMIAFGPIVCWAQSDGKIVPLEGSKTVEVRKPPAYASSAGIYDVTLPQVRDHLALTAQQQPLWSAYESTVNAYAASYYREKPVLPSQEDTAPHQIGRLVDNLQNRLASLEEIERAAKTLYASLTPEQQKIANQMMISTIPTFTSSGSGFSPSPDEDRRKGSKADAGMRPHRGGPGQGRGGMNGGGIL